MSFESAVYKNGRVPTYSPRDQWIQKAVFFWLRGLDTKQIALRMSVPEYRIYNHMDKVKGQG